MKKDNLVTAQVSVSGTMDAVALLQQLQVELERAKTLVRDLALSIERLSVEVNV